MPNSSRIPRHDVARRIAASITLTALFLNGCAAAMSQGAMDPASPAQQRMYDRSTLYTKSVGGGALLGAGTGALIGALAAKDSGKGAAIGAGAGLIAGLIAGVMVANAQNDYADREVNLDTRIAEESQTNALLEQAVADIDAVTREDEARLAEVRQQLDSGQANKEAIQRRLARVRKDREHIQKTIEVAQKENAKLAETQSRMAEKSTEEQKQRLQALIQKRQELIARAESQLQTVSASAQELETRSAGSSL